MDRFWPFLEVAAPCYKNKYIPVDISGTVVGESPDCLLLSETVVGENQDHVCWDIDSKASKFYLDSHDNVELTTFYW